MRTIHRSYPVVLAMATILTVTFIAPVAVHARDQTVAMTLAGPSGEESSSDIAVEATRVLAVQGALHSGDLGSMQEDALSALVAGQTSAETSGEEALEAKRAELLAQFRAVELASSRFLGTE